MERIIDVCNSDSLGINLDTGNLLLGGGDSIEIIQKLSNAIEHVHWKDLPEEFLEKRGKIFRCGIFSIELGKGVVGI